MTESQTALNSKRFLMFFTLKVRAMSVWIRLFSMRLTHYFLNKTKMVQLIVIDSQISTFNCKRSKKQIALSSYHPKKERKDLPRVENSTPLMNKLLCQLFRALK